MSKKNIFFLSDNFPPEHNAAASRVYERGQYWVKEGHELTVLTSFPNFPEGKVYDGYQNNWFGHEVKSGIHIYRVKTFIAANKKFLLRILDFLSYMVTSFFAGLFLIRKKHDVVVVTSPQFFAAVSAWALAKIKRKPFVFELGDLWPESIKAVGALQTHVALKWIEKLELFMYREAAVVIALTEAFKVNLVSRGIDPDKIFVVRNGVDLTLHKPKPKERALIEKHQLEGKFVIGYIGTHGLAHDLHRVIEVAEVLSNIEPSVVFMFVGEGADKAHLIEQTALKNLKNVIFIPAQPKEKIGDYWSLLSVALVHLKNSETFKTVIPSKMFESMAYGLPVLMIAPEGEAVQIMRENKNGICLTDYNLETFVKAIQELVRAPEMMKLYSANAFAATQRHTRQKQAELFLEALDTIKPVSE